MKDKSNRRKRDVWFIAQSLRDAREDVGWSQTQLAHRTGLKPCAISHFETGTRTPSLPNFRAICKALGCSADTVLRLSDAAGGVA